MSESFETTVAPDMPGVRDWLARLRLQKGLDAARQALHMLRLRHPDHAGVQELLDWHDLQWWQPLDFGGIRLERRAPATRSISRRGPYARLSGWVGVGRISFGTLSVVTLTS